ncbi:3-oxoacyl-[acyl-carrier protein] reductase [Salana multivorans]|uniref:3-oxoacyl-[acyl-carrier protein] reductase n=1 Tax=Salana multivorans TaxID=120377 RepID=A0A3N2DAQ1_9MICO|nr:SDR family oxidoreductase [Salana multivorans]OJX97022.1 MAG: hypothetical protein BGO96_02915 [Micrococcales bacterium 73-15]ROR96880.1 3-oxoacyl-[acyl-carrier protein] reductase [Salana multivorans]
MTDNGLRCLVTGAASGIGAAVAERLRARGDRVVGADREELPDGLRVDLSDPAGRHDLVARASDVLGGLDVLVNVAGVFAETPVLSSTLEQWRAVWAVDLEAPLELMREAAVTMAATGFGRIVNITSVHAGFAQPDCLAYDVAKAGLEAATRSFALDTARHGVLVNAVAPGFVRTRMSLTAEGVDETDTEAFRERYVRHGLLPLGRAALPEEIAHVVGWLASRENTYVTGQVLVADGGLTTTF